MLPALIVPEAPNGLVNCTVSASPFVSVAEIGLNVTLAELNGIVLDAIWEPFFITRTTSAVPENHAEDKVSLHCTVTEPPPSGINALLVMTVAL